MTLLDAALDYAGRGWPVFPIYEPDGLGGCACKQPGCSSPAKHPRNVNGFKGASADAAVVDRWWKRSPRASVGLATGTPSGLWVLDVDIKDAGDVRLAELEAKHGALPPTLEARTGGGGRHIFFRQRDGLRSSSGKNGGFLGAGLDVRADGGYVVAAPSLHLSGSQYTWAEGRGPGTAVADIPQWILDLEHEHQERLNRAVKAQVEIKRYAGGRVEDFEEAVRVYNLQNGRQYSKDGGPCPLCPGRSGFKAHAKIPDRWVCWSPAHEKGGRRGNGQWFGDLLDIDSTQRGRTRREHLISEGYWTPRSRVEAFAEERDRRIQEPQPEQPPEPSAAAPRLASVHQLHPPVVAPKRTAPLSRSFASLCDIFEIPELARPVLGDQAVEFNEMSGEVCLGRQALDEDQVNALRRRIELCHCDLKGQGLQFSDAEIWKALSLVSKKHRYHPVREYLSGLTWDGTPRLADVPKAVLKAKGLPIEQTCFRRWAISAVARAYEPGVKADCMLVLQGPQGALKSTFLKRLAGAEWFSDSRLDLHNKDSYLQIRGVWIYEWAELESMKRARDESSVKAFLSSAADSFRAPYGKGIIRVLRSQVFAGTINPEQFLTDETGNRRYLVIACGPELDLALIDQQRDQLWAEAKALYDSGEQHFLTATEQRQLDELLEGHMEGDPWEDIVRLWLDEYALPAELTTATILEDAVRKPRSQWEPRKDEMRIARVMKALGYRQDRAGPRTERRRVWVRKEAPTPP